MSEPAPLTPLGLGFDRLAAAEPDAAAVTFRGHTVTREQLARRSNQLARRLQSLGVTPGDMVTIGLPNGVAFYEAVLATWKLGAVPQPVSYRLPRPELAALIDVADPVVVIGLDPGRAGPGGHEHGKARPWISGDEPLDGLDEGPLPPLVSPTWKAMTSGGSTGRPKLIVATTPAVIELVAAGGPLLRIGERETFLCTGPLYHNGPFLFSLTALLQGGHVVVMERFEASRCLELVERHQVTYMYLVPTMMSRILRLPEDERLGRDISSVRTAYHLAAPCPPHVKHAWIDWLGPEGQAATVIDGAEWLAHPGSVGRVAMGEMRVTGPDGEDLPAGAVGEIWMRPPPDRVTYRYVGAEPVARHGWESLGDMGWFDEDGYLYLADRQTDMILVGGANVYPAEVEAVLDEHPAVLSSCVIGLPDEDYGSVVHAIVETRVHVTDDELRAHLAERLVGYKLPRTFERSSEPLRDDAGKVRRSALRAARLPA